VDLSGGGVDKSLKFKVKNLKITPAEGGGFLGFMRKEKNFLIEIEIKSSKHPPGQIFLDRGDLYEIFLASKFGYPNWHPGHIIQVGDSRLKQNSLAEEALGYLISSERYEAKRQRQGSQTILKPNKNKIDETVRAAIELGRIDSLKPLIDIFSQFSEIISSATLLPNTSLGVVNRRTGACSPKINGVILEINIEDGRLKPKVAQLVNQMRWPFGRAISVVGLQEIDINSFVLHFGEGDDLKADVLRKGVKFVDFYFGPEGEMYLVLAAGGKRGLPEDFFMGTKKQIENRWLSLLEEQKNLHQQINQTIVSRIGGGVISEEVVFSLPYVGAYFDGENRILLVSGASFLNTSGPLFINQGPNEPGILVVEENLLHPVGINRENLVTMSKKDEMVVPNGTSLIPVRQFGLL
jgi:hypothetical protein